MWQCICYKIWHIPPCSSKHSWKTHDLGKNDEILLRRVLSSVLTSTVLIQYSVRLWNTPHPNFSLRFWRSQRLNLGLSALKPDPLPLNYSPSLYQYLLRTYGQGEQELLKERNKHSTVIQKSLRTKMTNDFPCYNPCYICYNQESVKYLRVLKWEHYHDHNAEG